MFNCPFKVNNKQQILNVNTLTSLTSQRKKYTSVPRLQVRLAAAVLQRGRGGGDTPPAVRPPPRPLHRGLAPRRHQDHVQVPSHFWVLLEVLLF